MTKGNSIEEQEGSPDKIEKRVQFEDEPAEFKKSKKVLRLSPEETDQIIDLLTTEFVKFKREKLRSSVRLYNWLNRHYTE